jgi:hypothetical protein
MDANYLEELLQNNEARRRADVTDGLVDVTEGFPLSQWSYLWSTVCTKVMAPAWVPRDVYRERLNSAFQFFQDLEFRDLGFVVAGGAAVFPYLDQLVAKTLVKLNQIDIDFFYVGGAVEPQGSGELDALLADLGEFGPDSPDERSESGESGPDAAGAADAAESHAPEAENVPEWATGPGWRAVCALSDRIVAQLERNGGSSPQLVSFTRQAQPGLVSITYKHARSTYRTGPILVKIDIILREYRHVSALLHGFDVPSTSVCYDGTRVLATELGRCALMYGINVVLPLNRSPTFEDRLVKYWQRGFQLVLPKLKPVAAGAEVTLRHLQFRVTAACGPRLVVADLSVVRGDGEKKPGADYGSFRRQACAYYSSEDSETMAKHQTLWANIRRLGAALATGTPENFTPVRVDFTLDAYGATPRSRRRSRATQPKFPQLRPDVLPESEAVSGALRSLARKLRRGCAQVIDLGLMARLGATSDERVALATELAGLRTAQERKSRAKEWCDGQRERLQQALEAKRASPPEWWVKVDPHLQRFTASAHPEPEDDDTWYGDFYSPDAPPASDRERLAAILGLSARGTGAAEPDAARPMVSENVCAICFEQCTPGERNTIRLECGHTFHACGTLDGCAGAVEWIHRGNGCPMCRGGRPARQGRRQHARRPRRGLNSSDGSEAESESDVGAPPVEPLSDSDSAHSSESEEPRTESARHIAAVIRIARGAGNYTTALELERMAEALR